MKVNDFLAVIKDASQLIIFDFPGGYGEPETQTMCADHWRKLGIYNDRTIKYLDVDADGALWLTLEDMEDD